MVSRLNGTTYGPAERPLQLCGEDAVVNSLLQEYFISLLTLPLSQFSVNVLCGEF